MANVTPLKTPRHESDEWQLRVDLAAAFRLSAELGWHEAVANHFSLAVSADGKQFLMNPKWRHFSRIKASDLMLLDANDKDTMKRPDAPDPSAWCIHGHLHARRPRRAASCICIPPMPRRIAGLADPEIKPIEQNTARFYNRVAYDLGLAAWPTMMQRASGWSARWATRPDDDGQSRRSWSPGETVAEAFDDLYYLERACQTLVLAYSTGQKLNIMPPRSPSARRSAGSTTRTPPSPISRR